MGMIRMALTDEEMEYCRNHPCVKSDNCKGAFYNPPHPQIKCGEDGHTAIDIVGLPHCLDWLYEHCPLWNGNEDDKGGE